MTRIEIEIEVTCGVRMEDAALDAEQLARMGQQAGLILLERRGEDPFRLVFGREGR